MDELNPPANISFDELLHALLDLDTPLHPRFLYRLSDLESDDLAQLEQAWPSVPDWRRQALMEDVEQLGENDTLLSFLELSRFAARDGNPKVRLPAVRSLWEYEEPELIPLFTDILKQDSETEIRASAATGLGRYIYLGEIEELPEETLHQVEETLLQVVGGSDQPLVRRRALESLGYSSREDVPSLIETAFTSGNRDWMASALFAMGRSADERWEPRVLKMLDNDFPALRLEAARAAGELEISEARSHLLELLDDPDEDVRNVSIWSLSQIGGEGVRERLEQMYEETEDEEEADYIETALDNLSFTEDIELYSFFDLPEGEDQEDFVDLEDLDDELFGDDEDDGKK